MIKKTAHTYRNAYSGLSKETWILSLVMLINRSGTMVLPFMTLYLTSAEMGYSIGDAGLVFGLFGLGSFSGSWIGGKLTDKTGFFNIQLISLLGGGVLFLVLGQMKSFPLICIITFLLSFVNEAFRPANSTAIAFYSKENNRTRSYSLNRLAINLGWSVGSAMGGILASINYELLFWVDGFTNIGAAILLWILLRRPAQLHKVENDKTVAPKVSVWKDKSYLLFTILCTIFAICFFQSFTNIPVYFKKGLNLSEPFIGFLLALNGIIIVLVEMVLIYKLEGKRNNLVYITLGVCLTGASFFILNIPIASAVGLATLMIILITFGEILSMPFMNSYWISRARPENRGQYAALHSMAWSTAQTIGPLSGAQVAEHLGFDFLWWFTGAIALIAAWAFHRMYRSETKASGIIPLAG
ncbi:MAG TPA: MFS transporter [Chitinophagaceae bacterium]|nr:MFS transporter [Chitinophagaceae bacterium]MCB9055937.1 MFS transporter [Chitinophagales bacterium]HPG10433.1 MFS transporter [Chitinophagaceae bacterium]HRX94700.1 MFS transporter [Chitinophagaceae bacterium]